MSLIAVHSRNEPAVRARLNIIAVLLFFLLVAYASQTYLNRRLPESWQYAISTPKDADLRSVMDRMGGDGWELVFARRASDGSPINPTMSYEMIFKKRGAAGDATTPTLPTSR